MARGNNFINLTHNILPVKQWNLDDRINNIVSTWELLIHKLVLGASARSKKDSLCSLGLLLLCNQRELWPQTIQ